MIDVLLIILWIVWAALLFGGFIFGKHNAENTRRMPTLTRLGSSFVLVIAAWLMAFTFRDVIDSAAIFPLLIAFGMTLGFIGDLFMAWSNIIGGMIAFGVGHVAYVIGSVELYDWLTSAIGRPNDPRTSLLIGFWLMIGFLGWVFVVWRKQEKRGVLHWASLIYCLLLSTTAGVASGLAVSFGGSLWLVALGAALFLLSDLIIAGRLFQKWSFPLIDDVIWLTYGPAQMLIVFLSTLTAAAIVLFR